jgi:hypothetical protein
VTRDPARREALLDDSAAALRMVLAQLEALGSGNLRDEEQRTFHPVARAG